MQPGDPPREHPDAPLPAPKRVRERGRVPPQALRRDAAGAVRSHRPAGHRAPGIRAGHHHPEGVRGVLPGGVRHLPLRAGERDPDWVPRFRGRQPRGVRATDPRPGPPQDGPLLRALPEPRARRPARHRPGPPRRSARRGHRVRHTQVRRRSSRPGVHIRHHGQPCGGARCGAGPWGAAARCGSHREDDPGQPHRGGHRQDARAAPADAGQPQAGGSADHGAAARGHRAPRLDPRGSRSHRHRSPGDAHPPIPSSERRGDHDPVRNGCPQGRGDREARSPRAQDPDGDGQRPGRHRAPSRHQAAAPGHPDG